MAKVKFVETRDYMRSHGKQPRGFGSWAFAFSREAKLDDLFWAYNMNYADAKKQAVAEAQRRGRAEVWVQP